MHRIVYKKQLSENVKLFDVEAPLVAKKFKAGQFLIVKIDEKGERIPLTIVDTDKENGTIRIIFQEVGKSTKKLGLLNVGDMIQDVIGPLGKPAEIKKFGKVVCVGGGVGVAPLYPQAKALKKEGNEVISIIGARNKDLIILEEEMKSVSDRLYITTDDGSYVRKGFVSDVLREILEKEKIDRVITIGPAIMMMVTARETKPYNVKTIASLNSIMVDGTGMCGACRVSVGGETKFACVDGPDFDAHLVDFELLMERQRIYLEEERKAMELFEEECKCR
ncbi:MAG TPA: sulfide/dihydroorotate dehydrogenase-like FAD/NAD-binding protein [Methanomicrobia archaeon]|nr:sulfide/dihydroorotate dehydrogenase-like FAD/NAD-binding protein [Methanomicrobia archaeon]